MDLAPHQTADRFLKGFHNPWGDARLAYGEPSLNCGPDAATRAIALRLRSFLFNIEEHRRAK